MKTVTLKDVRIEEVIIKPDQIVTIIYSVLDDEGNFVRGGVKSVTFDNLTSQEASGVNGFVVKLITKMKVTENL